MNFLNILTCLQADTLKAKEQIQIVNVILFSL